MFVVGIDVSTIYNNVLIANSYRLFNIKHEAAINREYIYIYVKAGCFIFINLRSIDVTCSECSSDAFFWIARCRIAVVVL